MNIAIIGAAGDVGREIAHQVAVSRLLGCGQRLVLVGNPEGGSARSTYGLAADLIDAHAEIAPRIDVVLEPDQICADLIIMAAGATPRPASEARPMDRSALAEKNAPLFASYASALAKHGHGHEIVVCVSNPNELAVAIFAAALDRRRVMGMGSFLDSLRFRQEIAADLGVPRQAVHAFAVGEHGSAMVPLWSGVHVYGFDAPSWAREETRIRKGVKASDFPSRVQDAQQRLSALIAAGRVAEAYRVVDRYPPDVRAVVRPFITHYSGAKTVIGTARATMEFLETIALGSDALVCGQIVLDGEVYGARGAIGVPFVVGNRGVDRVFELPMNDVERAMFLEASRKVQAQLLGPRLDR